MTAHAAPRSRRRALVLLGATLVLALVIGAYFVTQGMRADARAQFDAALKQFEASQAAAHTRVDSAEAAVGA